jgi:zinc protease
VTRGWPAVACLILSVVACAGASAQTPEAATTVRWPSEGPPRPLQARSVRFPPYEIRTLPNGLQVVVVLHHEQPAVSIRLIVRAGSALDAQDRLGLADLTASLLDQGTTTRSATELNDEIDFMGGEMGAGAGIDLSFVTAVVMKDSFDAGLRLLSDVVRHPAFAPSEVERQRQQMLSSLQVSAENPEYIANSIFDRLVYGFHPYGLPASGTPSTIAAITRDDIVGFHQRNFVPNNCLLAVVGDLAADEAFNGVTSVFGDWERREVPPQAFRPPPDPTRRVIVVNKPDSVQTEIRVGHLGVKRNTSDYMALNLAVRILGGEGANRLHQVLRTERSLTYGAEAEFHTFTESGDFRASTNTRSSATGEVVRLIVDEFWRLQRETVNQRELADAKAYLTGSFPLTIETPDAIATQVLNVLVYGLPVEDLESFRERVNAVTPEDIQRVARFYLRPDRLSIVLVGDASVFVPQMRGIGFGTFELIEAGSLDLTAPDFKRNGARAGASLTPRGPQAAEASRHPQPPPARRGSASRVAWTTPSASSARMSYRQESGVIASEGVGVQALLDEVIAAKGGLETLRAVKTIRAVTRAEAQTPGGPLDVETTTYLEYPNRVRVETKLPGELIVQGYDGSRAWVRDARGIHDVPDRMRLELESSFRRDVLGVLIAAHDGRVRARLLPDVRDQAGKVHHALEFSAVGLEPVILYIDPETHLVAKQVYVVRSGNQQPMVEELFADYRLVDGVQIAFSATVRQGGERVLERRVADIRINPPVDPALFKRPST